MNPERNPRITTVVSFTAKNAVENENIINEGCESSLEIKISPLGYFIGVVGESEIDASTMDIDVRTEE